MIPKHVRMLEALEKTLQLWQSGAYKDDGYKCPLYEFFGMDCHYCPCYVLLDEPCFDMHLDCRGRYAPRMAISYLNKMIAMVKEKIV